MISVLNIATIGNSSGSYLLNAGSLHVSQYETVGYSGTGAFSQSGGTNSTSEIDIASSLGGSNPAGSGTYTLAAGQFSAGVENVGIAGPGTFNQSGGTNTVSTALTLGSLSGASGSYSLVGGTLILKSLSAGSGTADFNFGGGTLQANGALSTSLPMTLTATGGNATIDTAGYAVTLSGSLSGPGRLTKVDGGTLILAATNTYSGDTLITGGTLALGNPWALQNSTLDTSGNGALSFGTLGGATLGGLTGSGKLALSNAPSAAVALTVGNNSVRTTYSGTLSGRGSLIKIGSGVLLLGGSSTYSGPTTINQGELLVNGSLVSAVTVSSGAVGGSGTLGTVTVSPSGAIAPGSPLGTLTLGGSLILSSGAMLDYDLDTPSSSGMIACGPVVASSLGFSTFSFENTSNFVPGVYDLIQSNTPLPGNLLGGSTSGSIGGYPANLAVSGKELVLNVAPEPGTLALLATGALIGVGWQYRRPRSPPLVGAAAKAPAGGGAKPRASAAATPSGTQGVSAEGTNGSAGAASGLTDEQKRYT